MSEKIYVSINGKKREINAKELEQRELDKIAIEAEASRIEAETAKKQADRESAMAKLSKLGLTEDEIAALVP